MKVAIFLTNIIMNRIMNLAGNVYSFFPQNILSILRVKLSVRFIDQKGLELSDLLYDTGHRIHPITHALSPITCVFR